MVRIVVFTDCQEIKKFAALDHIAFGIVTHIKYNIALYFTILRYLTQKKPIFTKAVNTKVYTGTARKLRIEW